MKKGQLEIELLALQHRLAELQAQLLQQTNDRQVSEQVLAESSGRFQNLFESMAQGVIYQDATGAILLANPAAERILGLTLDEIQKRKPLDPRWSAVHEDGSDFPADQYPAALAFRTGKPVRDVVMGVFHPQTETYRWIQVDAIPEFRGEDERPYQVYTTFTDITDRKQNEAALLEREQKLNQLLDILPVGVSILDASRQVVFNNPALEQVLQLTKEGLFHGDYHQRTYLAGDGTSMSADDFASARAQKSGQAVYDIETGVVKEGGETIWTSVSAVPVDFPDWKTVIVTTDITERKQARDKLEIQQRNLDALIENTDGSIWSVDRQYRLIIGNKLYYQNTSAALGRQFAEGECVLAPEFPQAALDEWQGYYDRALKGERFSVEVQTRFVHPVHFVEYRFSPIVSGSRDITGVTVFGRDITERKREAEAWRQSEARYRLISENAADVIWVLDPFKGQFTYISPSVHKLRGYTPEEVMAQTVNEALTPESLKIVSESLAANLPAFITKGFGTESFINEVDQPHKDGSIVHTEVTTTYLFNERGEVEIVGVSRDITERKRAEEKLRESEEFLRLAYEAADLGVWKNDLATGAVSFDERACMHYGFDRLEVSLADVMNRIHPEDAARLGTEIAAATAPTGSGKFTTEYRVIHPDGSVHWLAIGVRVIFEGAGEQRHAVMGYGTSMDITDRKHADEERRIALLKYKALFDAFPLGITVSDLQGDIIEANTVAEKLLGLSKEEQAQRQIDGAEWRIIRPDGSAFPPDEYPSVRALRGGRKVENVEMGVYRPEGKVTWINVTAAPLPLQEYGVVVTYHDITERKLVEQVVQENKAKLDAALASMTDAVFISDAAGNFIHFNDAFATFHKFRNKEECAKTFAEYPEFLDVYMDTGDLAPVDMWAVSRALRGEIGTNVEYSLRRKDTGETWVGSYSFAPIRDQAGGIVGSVVVGRDITERRLMEAELRDSEERFSTAFFSSPVSQSIIIQGTSEIVAVNNACCDLFGYSRKELIGTNTAKLNLWEDPAERLAAVEELQKTGHLLPRETTVRVKSGEIRTVIVAIEPILWKGLPCLISSVVDITERKQIEKLLQESEHRYRELVENANSAIIRWKSNGEITFFNEYAQSFFGYRPEEVIGRPVGILVPQADSSGSDLSMLVQNIVNHPEQYVNVVNENICKDGHRVWMAWTNKPAYDEKGRVTGILAVGGDITERKRTEDELRRSNAELEQFAYVASHDLQEPLRAVAGMVELLQQRYQGQLDERANEYIHLAVDAANRMQALINDLLAFSRVERRGRPFEAVEVAKCIKMALQNLDVAVRENGATITWGELPIVRGDAMQLVQLFQNLIGNGIKFRGDREPRIDIRATRLDDMWQFSIEDNGIGIEEQYFERIFLVFQRLHTRRKYSGTGIGLALCKKIVERHEGRIWVESEPEQGSTFHFTIPTW